MRWFLALKNHEVGIPQLSILLNILKMLYYLCYLKHNMLKNISR